MKTVPLKTLKECLSEIMERASKGEIIEVTKYNRPFVVIYPATHRGLHVGSEIGRGLKSVAKVSEASFKEILEEDRSDET